MLGLKRGTVKLLKHNPKWKKSFEKEKKLLIRIFDKDALLIEHVGSTAVAGILAKPIVDIAVVTSSLRKVVSKYKDELLAVGYVMKKENRKDRLFFTKGPEVKRTHYLHVGSKRGRYVEDMIVFRDYLLSHRDTASQYSKLKQNLTKKYQDKREKYTESKTRFVDSVIRLNNLAVKRKKCK